MHLPSQNLVFPFVVELGKSFTGTELTMAMLITMVIAIFVMYDEFESLFDL